MNWLSTILVLGTAFLAVFWEAAFGGVRHFLGAQIDLLPPLMVYAGLCTGITTVTALALAGGLWFDSLSANPLGVTVLPLFAAGLAIHLNRELILRDETFAQLVLGLSASAATPLATLIATKVGYDGVLLLALVLYGCAVVSFPPMRKTLPWPDTGSA